MAQVPSLLLPVLATAVLLAGCTSVKSVRTVQLTTPSPTHTAPRIQIGWYTDMKASFHRLDTYQRTGVTLMVASYAREPYTSRWVHAASAHHIRVLLQPDPSWIRHGDIQRLQAFVRRYRHTQAVAGWYLYDEPDRTGLPPDKLQAAYRKIKALDRHPVAAVFTTGQCLFGQGAINPGYLTGFDLLMFDRYPFYLNLPGVQPLEDERTIDANCVQSARAHGKLGPILVLQGFGRGQKDGPYLWRDPTYGETLCSFRLAVAAGASGVLFYSDQYADMHVWNNVEHTIRAHHEAHLKTAGGSKGDSC